MNRASIVIVAMIIVAFGLILWLSSVAGMYFGKAGENIALGIIALILIIILVKTRKEK